MRVIIREDVFPQGVDDELWLERAGAEQWIVFTKDKAIRKRDNERLALLNAGVRTFVLTAGNVTGAEQVEIFVRIFPKIRRYVAELRGPFIVRVEKSGAMKVIEVRAAHRRRR